MENGNNEKKQESVYSKRIKAGKRRTYFFDVRETRGSDFYLTITESRKRFDSDGYDRHKIFLYKEDFNKFVKGLGEAVGYVKTELMPDFDFDAFNHDTPYEGEESGSREVGSREGSQETYTTSTTGDAVEEGGHSSTTEAIVANVTQSPEIIEDASKEDEKTADNGGSEEVDKW